MGSLQDALLKTGLAEDRQKSERKVGGASAKGRPPPRGRKSKKKSGKRAADGSSQSSDLERAWIARRKAEKDEKERVKQARVADQEARRKRNLQLDGIVEGKALNVEEAEVPRYFEHLGRIRRVLCTREQRDAINSGKLGIVNLRGRYLIVEPEILQQYRALAEDLVPDLSGAEPAAGDEENGDYPPVPDDLAW
ncbi:MAG: DUF2058 family protein [Wenzhouxiangellaceae bacterium]